MEKSRRKNLKHSNSEKLRVIELYEQGYGSTSISNDLQISTTVVKTWIRLYQSQGLSGFDKQPNRLLSIELKEQVVRDVLNKFLSFPTVALKYHISQSTAYQWVELVKREGFSSLKETKTGRPTTVMGRPKKKQSESRKLSDCFHFEHALFSQIRQFRTIEFMATTLNYLIYYFLFLSNKQLLLPQLSIKKLMTDYL